MSIKEIKQIVKKIKFTHSHIDMGYKFKYKEVFDKKGNPDGFLIKTSFKRGDINTGLLGTGYGRWMFIDKNADERSVVMTVWVCVELVIKHELMESFTLNGIRILDPHKSLEELSYPSKLANLPTKS